MSEVTRNEGHFASRPARNRPGVARRIATFVNAIGIGVTIILFGIAYILLGVVTLAWRLVYKLIPK